MDTKQTPGAGRASYTVKEIAERSALSVTTIYREIYDGRLIVCNIGPGGRRGLRITATAEADWLKACAHRPRIKEKIGGKERREEQEAA